MVIAKGERLGKAAVRLRREQGDRPGAEACLLRLIDSQEGPHFASVVEGLRGHKARHNLAVIYHEEGRHAEAEAQWQAAVREQPAFAPAWLGLGELPPGETTWTHQPSRSLPKS